jgi:NADH-quinone oxidoreductase subunit J
METVLAGAGAIAVAATALVFLQREAVHALLYLIVSLFALAVSMLALGAAFVAALEVIVYAGAIMVLFVFVVMMIGSRSAPVGLKAWIGPALLAAALLALLLYALLGGQAGGGLQVLTATGEISPKKVGAALLGPYGLASEIAAFLLLSGLVGAFRIGSRTAAEKTAEGKTAAGAEPASPARETAEVAGGPP